MVDVTSSGVALVNEVPDTTLGDAKMTNEFGSNSVSELCQRCSCSNVDEEQERFILVRFEERKVNLHTTDTQARSNPLESSHSHWSSTDDDESEAGPVRQRE